MAVSIWEGNKAQALIDAISSNEKISKQQGAGNLGKVLVVGADGIVVPTYTVLPDAVKTALMNCFAHVVWDTADGETTYGRALQNALYNYSPEPSPTPVDERIVYECLNIDAFNRLSNADSGTQIIKSTNDFTIIVKGNIDCKRTESGPILINARGINNTTFIRIQFGTDATNETAYMRTSYRNIGGNTNTFSKNEKHDFIAIIRNIASTSVKTIKMYIDGVKSYEYEGTQASSTEALDENYLLGIGNTTTDIPNALPGVFDIFRIYNAALSDDEISEITGIDFSA